MLYESAEDKTTMIQPLTVEDLKRNPEVKKTRRILIILLSIELAFGIWGLLLQIVAVISADKGVQEIVKTSSTDTPAAAILFTVIGIIFTIIYIGEVLKYNRTGILVLVWITVIGLIVGLIVEILEINQLASATHETIPNKKTDTFSIIIGLGIGIIFTISKIIFSFKLAKLIRIQKLHQIV